MPPMKRAWWRSRPEPWCWPWAVGNGPGGLWPFRGPSGRGPYGRCGPGLHQSPEPDARQEVVILGSGDIGLIMARRLTLEGLM